MKVSQKEEEKEKRREIIQEKTNRLHQITEKLKDIEVERQKRRIQRNQNQPSISTSRSSSAMSSSSTLRASSSFEDPEISQLRLKIQAKKNARLHKKNISNSNSGKNPFSSTSFTSSDLNKLSILPTSATSRQSESNSIISEKQAAPIPPPTIKVNHSHLIEEVMYYGEEGYVLESLKGNLARMRNDEVETVRKTKHATFAETESQESLTVAATSG
jgi:hypothetical protein